MLKISALLILLLSCTSYGAPLGLYEGMMSNSGAATSDSKASSFYNPSLLRQRDSNAFNLNGTSLTSANSKENGQNISSSFELSPSYVSTIVVGDSLVHEAFLATTLQGLFSWRNSSESSNSPLTADANINRMISGYSMAFRSIPLALQFLARYSEIRMTGSGYDTSIPGSYVISTLESEYRDLSLALGISSHFEFDSYTLGVNFNSRGASIFRHDNGNARVYIQTPTGIEIHEMPSRASISNEESKLIIGHSFRLGLHEFLTDSIFVEQSTELDRYKFSQTFGYRYGAKDGHQFLCGFAHRFGSDTSYFTQSMTVSAGYSWKTRQLRSALGFFYSKENSNVESSTLALMFGSEYAY